MHNRVESGGCSYVLLTAAYNEEENIGQTIESVISQTRRPDCWIIVSDGSVDRTDEIVKRYCKEHNFIRLLRVTRQPGRSFGSKVRALHAGHALLENQTYRFVGNLDADVSVSPDYFHELLERFQECPGLGIAGGYVVELGTDGKFHDRRQNRAYSVAHAAQLVRRECYEAIGGYAVLEYGGEDWHAQISAKMRGWDVHAYPELKIFHHRHTGEGDNLLRHKFRQGQMDFSFGSDPLFELFKCIERMPERPLILGSLARFSGFVWPWLRKDKRPVSSEFIGYLRAEQRAKLSAWMPRFRSPAQSGSKRQADSKVENF